MKLTDCTKADLLWIIKRMLQRYLGNGEYELQRALNDLEYEKFKRGYEEAEKCAAMAAERRQQYIELLAPYDGKSILDIPLQVLEKADSLAGEVAKYDARWNKLMGIDM